MVAVGGAGHHDIRRRLAGRTQLAQHCIGPAQRLETAEPEARTFVLVRDACDTSEFRDAVEFDEARGRIAGPARDLGARGGEGIGIEHGLLARTISTRADLRVRAMDNGKVGPLGKGSRRVVQTICLPVKWSILKLAQEHAASEGEQDASRRNHRRHDRRDIQGNAGRDFAAEAARHRQTGLEPACRRPAAAGVHPQVRRGSPQRDADAHLPRADGCHPFAARGRRR